MHRVSIVASALAVAALIPRGVLAGPVSQLHLTQDHTIHALSEFVYGGEFAAVPEPASLVLFGCGLLGFASIVRRKACSVAGGTHV